MREHKYRVWHIGNKKMITPACVMFCPNELREYRIWEASDGEFLGNDKHFEVMQFTGLFDKNGKEIYDGDILRWWVKSTKSYADELLEVKWGTVGWILKSPLFKSFGVPAELAKCSEVNTFGYIQESEVIGNIYENPELINSPKQV